MKSLKLVKFKTQEILKSSFTLSKLRVQNFEVTPKFAILEVS